MYSVADNHVAFTFDPLPDCHHSAGNLLSAMWTMHGSDLTLRALGGVDADSFDQLICCTKSWYRIADPPSGNEMQR